MISDHLVKLLENQADRLTDSWIKMLRQNQNTMSYHKMEDAELIHRIRDVYERLHLWLDWEIAPRDVARFFMQIGNERKKENIPLSEICYAVILARRNLYIHVMEESVPQDSLGMQQLIELNSRIAYFFDKATYFIIKGYEDEEDNMKENDGLFNRILQAFQAGTSLSSHEK